MPTLFLLINQGWNKQLHSLYRFNRKEKELLVVNNKQLLSQKINKILSSKDYRLEFLKLQDSFLRIRMNSEVKGASKLIDDILG